MSMTTSPFGTPVETAAPAALQPVQEEEPQSSKRTVIILAVVAAALAIGAGAYFLLFSGGEAAEVAGAPVAPRAPSATASAPAAVPAPPIKKFVAKKSRNPFVPLVAAPVVAVPVVAAPVVAAPGTTSGTTTGATGTTTGATGTTSVPVGGTATGTTNGTTAGTVPLPSPVPAPAATKPTTSSKPVAVSVLAVDFVKRTASIKVNRNTYNRTIGDTFAQYFKLIAVTKGSCAYVQYGDVALPMCVGQPLTLQ